MFWYFQRFWYSLLHCFCWVFWMWQKTLIITNHTFFLWNCKIFPHFVVFLIYFNRNMMSNFSRWRNLQRPEKLSSKIFIRSYPLFFEYWWFLSDIIVSNRFLQYTHNSIKTNFENIDFCPLVTLTERPQDFATTFK